MPTKPPTALSTAKTFNDLARRAADKGAETLSLIWKAGETAKLAKSTIPHGEWLKFVDQYYDVSHDTVRRWVKFHETVPESKLRSVRNLTAGLKMLDAPKQSASAPRHREQNKHVASDSSDGHPSADTPGEDGRTEPDGQDAQEPTPTPPRSGKAKRGAPSPKLDKEAYYKQWEASIGPLVRLVDKIANGTGSTRDPYCVAIHEALQTATDNMAEWMGVES